MESLQHGDDFTAVAQWPLNADVETEPRAFTIVAAAQQNVSQSRKFRRAVSVTQGRAHRPARHIQRAHETFASPVFRLLDDDISAIGTWYLQDSLPSPSGSFLSSDKRGPTHNHWALAIWSQALQDPLLFKCLAVLTLHKKRTLAGTWDRVSYFQHKHDAYQLLRTQIEENGAVAASSYPPRPSSASPQSNSVVALAPVVCLISFIEVMEGRFEEAAMHIRSMATFGDVAALDVTQWAFVAWNDLRYAMKMAAPPVLPGTLPAVYLAQVGVNCVESTFGSESRRRALANWKHAQTLLPDSCVVDALFEILQGIYGLHILLPDLRITFDAKLAKLYQIEYKLHTLAAHVATHDAVHESAGATLFLVALQLHLLALASSYAPSTPECRHFLLARARGAAQNLQIHDGADRNTQSDAPLIWALFVLATHSDKHAPRRHDDASAEVFFPLLARLVAAKGFRSRTVFLNLLQNWPEIAPWYPTQAAAIWSKLLVLRGKRWVQQVTAPDATEDSSLQVSQQPWFSGVLMFYS
jgi:hypothetical protein